MTPKYVHSPLCSGCPICNEEFARVLTMTPTEYSAWLTRRFSANAVSAPPSLIAAMQHPAPRAEQRMAAFFGGPRPLAAPEPVMHTEPARPDAPLSALEAFGGKR